MTDKACDACKLPPFPPEIERDADTGLPTGWFVRRVAGRTFTLCECCGDIRHFKGGVSLYLQENLGLAEHAKCEFDETPGSGLHRMRTARR
ncbi:MAG: hypothetical protein KJ622_07810 [Alphaproteobacteria bacterium]|nr:hypothetical protein [Alphaproteobacteria bacterium]